MEKQGINEWLTALLADGPLPTFDVTARAQRAGYKRQELRLARAELHVRTIRCAGGAGWMWALPDPRELARLRQVDKLLQACKEEVGPCL